MEENIYDVIRYRLKQEGFELLEGKYVFVKDKLYNSAIGLNHNTDEIFIRCDFIELVVKQCLKEMIDNQLKDLNRVREELNT